MDPWLSASAILIATLLPQTTWRNTVPEGADHEFIELEDLYNNGSVIFFSTFNKPLYKLHGLRGLEPEMSVHWPKCLANSTSAPGDVKKETLFSFLYEILKITQRDAQANVTLLNNHGNSLISTQNITIAHIFGLDRVSVFSSYSQALNATLLAVLIGKLFSWVSTKLGWNIMGAKPQTSSPEQEHPSSEHQTFSEMDEGHQQQASSSHCTTKTGEENERPQHGECSNEMKFNSSVHFTHQDMNFIEESDFMAKTNEDNKKTNEGTANSWSGIFTIPDSEKMSESLSKFNFAIQSSDTLNSLLNGDHLVPGPPMSSFASHEKFEGSGGLHNHISEASESGVPQAPTESPVALVGCGDFQSPPHVIEPKKAFGGFLFPQPETRQKSKTSPPNSFTDDSTMLPVSRIPMSLSKTSLISRKQSVGRKASKIYCH